MLQQVCLFNSIIFTKYVVLNTNRIFYRYLRLVSVRLWIEILEGDQKDLYDAEVSFLENKYDLEKLVIIEID